MINYARISVIDARDNRLISNKLYDIIDAITCEFEVMKLTIHLLFARDRRVTVDYFDWTNKVIHTRHL